MIHKHVVEALDRTLQDIFIYDKPFGGKVIVFGGDFRQILPVVQGGSRQEIVNASIVSSYVWSLPKVLRLTKNTRLTIGNQSEDVEEMKIFAKWLLDLGEGKIGGSNVGQATIEIPKDLLIDDGNDPLSKLIDCVYPSIVQHFMNPNFFQEQAILAPINEVVDEINEKLLSFFLGNKMEYLISDRLCETEEFNDAHLNMYSLDVLNGLKISGLSNHRLVLKVGIPVMLLRNIDQQNGLFKDTRLQIISLGKRVIEVEIISGENIGSHTFLPRINMVSSDKKMHLNFNGDNF